MNFEIVGSDVAGWVPKVSQLDKTDKDGRPILVFGWNRKDGIYYGLRNVNGSKQVIAINGGSTPPPPINAGAFKGTCDTKTDPGTPSADEWWSAQEVGVYTNFGGVEVTTMTEVFNYIKWSQANSLWTIETVAVNMGSASVPRLIDGIFDLFVNANLEVGVKPYDRKKPIDPQYAYFYIPGDTFEAPTGSNALILDGGLIASDFATTTTDGTGNYWTDMLPYLITSGFSNGNIGYTYQISTWEGFSSVINGADSADGYDYFSIVQSGPDYGDDQRGMYITVYNRKTGPVTTFLPLKIISSKLILVEGLPIYANNTVALAGGLTAGTLYRKSTGEVMIVY